MRRIRKKRTTVETHERVVVQASSADLEAFCPQCDRVVPILAPEQAAILCDVSLRTLFRRMDDGDLHFAELPDGRVFVCANSLFKT